MQEPQTAIALALRFSCPIFTYEKILDKAGVVRKNKKYENQKTTAEKTIQKKHEKTYGEMRLSELKKLLKKAIESENYEKASKIRDEINKRGNIKQILFFLLFALSFTKISAEENIMAQWSFEPQFMKNLINRKFKTYRTKRFSKINLDNSFEYKIDSLELEAKKEISPLIMIF